MLATEYQEGIIGRLKSVPSISCLRSGGNEISSTQEYEDTLQYTLLQVGERQCVEDQNNVCVASLP